LKMVQANEKVKIFFFVGTNCAVVSLTHVAF
jgi:hypothetical protein